MLPFIMFNCFLCSSDEDYTGKPDGGGFAVSIGKKKIFLFTQNVSILKAETYVTEM